MGQTLSDFSALKGLKKEMEKQEQSTSPASVIGQQWILVTAGTKENYNTMTASLGGIGYLWNKPVAFVFIRPERFTHDFIENQERMTLSL